MPNLVGKRNLFDQTKVTNKELSTDKCQIWGAVNKRQRKSEDRGSQNGVLRGDRILCERFMKEKAPDRQ